MRRREVGYEPGVSGVRKFLAGGAPGPRGCSDHGVMIRPARPDDLPSILHFIRELARYEKLEDQLDLDGERLRAHLFGPGAPCFAFLAEAADGVPVGFALCFQAYSTFKTRPFVHLEDLFVLPEHRGTGHGLGLLRAVAAAAVARGAPRLEWAVLDWNEPAIGFYRRHGATVLPDWRVCRVTGEALRALAGGDSALPGR